MWYQIYLAATTRLSLSLSLSAGEGVSVQTWSVLLAGSCTAGALTHPPSIPVKIHPAPDIERKKLCVRVVRKALPMIDVSQEDGMKGQEDAWRWGAVEKARC